MPKFSVITPCYNISSQICNINKLLSQTFTDFELILVNDCSLDKTKELLCSIKDVLVNQNIRTILIENEENKGAGESRNIAIQSCSGEYIVFLDSDDFFESTSLEALDSIITKNDYPEIVLFEYSVVKNGKKIQNKSFARDGFVTREKAFLHAPNGICGKCIKLSLVIDNDIRFLKIRRNEDFPFFRKAFWFSSHIFYTNQALYNYVINEYSLMHTSEFADPENAISAFTSICIFCDDENLLSCLFMKNCYYSNILCMLSSPYTRAQFRNRLRYLRETYSCYYITRNLNEFSIRIRIIVWLANFGFFNTLKVLYQLAKS